MSLISIYNVSLSNICTAKLLTITEFCEAGNLLTYLQEKMEPVFNLKTEAQMLAWSYQVAEGMQFLHSRSVIHGDLAARNVLLCSNLTCKIADFGMSLALHTYETYARTELKVLLQNAYIY